MGEREKNIVDKIAKAMPRMSEFDKGYFLGKVENLAKEADKNEKEVAENETAKETD